MGIWGKILLPPLMDFASYAPAKPKGGPPLHPITSNSDLTPLQLYNVATASIHSGLNLHFLPMGVHSCLHT